MHRVSPLSPLQASRITTELYRACMTLSEEARSLLVQNEGMKRLGLNAQAMAAQTGSQGGGLEVIVSEIGRLSHAIRDVLEALENSAKSLSQTSIEALHLSSLNASYEKGAAAGIQAGSEAIYRKTHTGIRSRRIEQANRLVERLRTVSVQMEDLGRYARQIPPMTTMIQIAVCDVAMKSEELLGTVVELKSLHSNLETKLEHMRRIRLVCSGYIGEFEKDCR
jgi:hypothetical protein